mmetsp:Transcript_26211/g.57656  ORF Transcript_26211/g.57656 Transcript_26211/m.57656 type:complete len:517 (-) Transcript_26211:103-1653(-)
MLSMRSDAILEWVNSLDVCKAQVCSLSELADGELLLRIMHDAAPDKFPGAGAVHITCLLQGLKEYFRGRPRGGEMSAQHLLSQVSSDRELDAVQLAELVVWATIESENKVRYVEACGGLTVLSQQAIRSLVEEFHEAEAEAESGREAEDDDAETPPRRVTAPRGVSDVDDHEWWTEERALLQRDLEQERERRRAAEEAERIARAELNLADEARDRLREEHHALLEVRLQKEVQGYVEQLQQRNDELDALRDELDVARSKAGAVEKLSTQLRESKRKLEEMQTLKRANGQLQEQLDDLMSRQTGAGAMERLHNRLEHFRVEGATCAEERDAAQHKVQKLTQELAQVRDEKRQSAERLAHVQQELRNLQLSAGLGDTSPSATYGASQDSTLAVDNAPGGDEPSRSRSPSGRASQVQSGPSAEDPQRGGRHLAEQVRELQTLLAQRERELQVHTWRGGAESDALQAQEALMASCFHELGVRFQRLRLRHDILQRHCMNADAIEEELSPEPSPSNDELRS